MQRLGRYELVEEIGHGGMATVYRAHDPTLDRFVAIKVLHPHLRGAREARVRFTREAKSVARLRHPNILEIYDYGGEDSEQSFIAAELLTGPTLKDYVADAGEIPAEIAACFGVQIASALAAAHASGIVHRDVKPENVLLHENRIVKLTDFGIAQMVDAQSFTATGQILGSPGHMAPEQIESGDCDERSDVFSLGTVLYYLAVGRLPFTGRNPHMILRRVMDAEYPDPLRVRPTIGPTLHRILGRCLARAKEDRYADVSALLADLNAFVAALGLGEPDALLRAYLADPAGVRDRVRAAALVVETRLGQQASDRGEVQVALDHWNRVLALDEGNQDVLRRIERVGRRSTQRRGVRLVAGGLLVLSGLVALGISFRPAPPRVEPDRHVATSPVRDAGAPTRVDAPPRAQAVPDASAPAEAGPVATPPRTRAERDDDAVRPRPPAQRTVLFRPTPQNVSIAVDDAPPRPFGPSFRQIQLDPGRHRFRFVPGTECCEEVTTEVSLSADAAPYVLTPTLPFRAARLYVAANTVADVVVTVDGAPPVRGRAREILRVPLRNAEEQARISVTAEGRREYTGRVRLRAGELTEASASLAPVEPMPPVSP